MTSPVKEGDVLAGKYRIERVLGVGGMGVVVAATHVQLDQKVALKFLLPDALATPDLVARFAREARAAARIESEHVARVMDVGTLESGSPYMVMEYLEGQDLSWVIHERGALPVEEAASYVLQTCEALAAAHAAGIIHRDLKPANLFLAQRPDREAVIKVLDFGISKVKASGAEDLALTKESSLVGSPLYMSPEQMATPKDVDARCDIWALGVIFYELLSGETPFTSDSVTGIVAAILQSHPRHPTDLRPEIPAEVSAIIMRCLEKDPARRFQSVSQLARALARFAPRTGRSSVERITRVLGTSVETSPTLIQTMPPPASLPAIAASSLSSPLSSPLSSTAGSGPGSTLSSRGATSTGAAAWGTTHGGGDGAHRRGIVVGVAAALALVGAMVAGGLIVLHVSRPNAPPNAPAAAASAPPPGENAAAVLAALPAAAPSPPSTAGVEGARALDAHVDPKAPDASAPRLSPASAARGGAAHAAAHTGASPSAAGTGAPLPDPKLEIRLQR